MTHRPIPLRWGAPDPRDRGPVVAGLDAGRARNAIGVHGGAFGLYRAAAIAAGELDPRHRPDLAGTEPVAEIGPAAAWSDPAAIVSLDPWGARVAEVFAPEHAAGLDIRPSIAVASGRLRLPEITQALEAGALRADGPVLDADGHIAVTKIAIEPVWHLPGVAARLGVQEARLREALHQHMGGAFPDLVTRPDLTVFLPPIGGASVYVFGDPSRLGRGQGPVACRVHDECNASDVFGSDLCTCRPYLVLGVAEAIRAAQAGGAGVVVYNRKEGRALGEVIKLLVYNARARQPGGDRPEAYFHRTERVAGLRDARLQALSADVLHWLGLRRIDRWVSMSHLKYDAITAQGIEIGERVALPEDLVPARAGVELEAKIASGYFTAAAF
jgi:GTP cyclohydrolase II